MPVSTSEADVILNRANVALAKSQRLIASWLPARTDEEQAHVKSEEEIEKEESEIFKPVPETLGLGAPLPKDSDSGPLKARGLSATDKLRTQLLGKNALKQRPTTPNSDNKITGKNQSGHPRPPQRSTIPDDDDEEDEGRSSLGKVKRKRNKVEEDDQATETHGDNGVNKRAMVKPRSSNYLDEVLSERAKRGKRKKKKNKDGAL